KLFRYHDDILEEQQFDNPSDWPLTTPHNGTTWVDIQGAPSTDFLHLLGEQFGLHPLALEDVANSGQRPKVESYNDHLFVVLGLPFYEDQQARMSQISLFLGKNFVISLHEERHDPYEVVRKRLRQHNGKMRSREADYLFYTLVDAIIDRGFPLLDWIGGELEELEEELLSKPNKKTLRRLHELKRDLLVLRRTLWPQRETMNSLYRDEETPIHDGIKIYFRDCYDHTIQIMDLLETYRDMTTNMLDLYLNSVSNRLNETIKVLTVVTTIFMPLTFIVGIYGMNFGNNSQSPWAMPELRWDYGYPMVWVVMLVVTGGLLYFFKRKGII
ncbi:MAG: magnesium transporter, partial [Halothiobacillaceae bacterium]